MAAGLVACLFRAAWRDDKQTSTEAANSARTKRRGLAQAAGGPSRTAPARPSRPAKTARMSKTPGLPASVAGAHGLDRPSIRGGQGHHRRRGTCPSQAMAERTSMAEASTMTAFRRCDRPAGLAAMGPCRASAALPGVQGAAYHQRGTQVQVSRRQARREAVLTDAARPWRCNRSTIPISCWPTAGRCARHAA